MNIDIIKPGSRLGLVPGTKCTDIQYIDNRLWVGTITGGIYVYSLLEDPLSDNEDKHLARNSGANPRNVHSSLKPYRSLNDIRSLFSKSTMKLDVCMEKDQSSPILKILKLYSSIDENSSKASTIVAIASQESIKIYKNTSSTLELAQTLSDAKGFVDLTYMESRRLLILVFKKVVVVYCLVSATNSSNIQFQKITEISFKEKLKCTCPYNESQMLVGLSNSFVILDVDANFTIKDLPFQGNNIFGPGSSFNYFGLNSSSPLTQILPLGEDKHEFLLIQDTVMVRFKNSSGIRGNEQIFTVVPTIKSNLIPIKVIYMQPCYLILIYAKKLEVIDYEDGELIQRFQHQINPYTLATAFDSKNLLYLGSGSEIFSFSVSSIQTQLEEFSNIGSNRENDIPKSKDKDLDVSLWGKDRAIKLITKLSAQSSFFDIPSMDGDNLKIKQLKLRQLYQSKAIYIFCKYSQFHKALVEIGSDWIIDFQQVLCLFPSFINPLVLLEKNGSNNKSPTSISSPLEKITQQDLKLSEFLDESSTENDTERNQSGTITEQTHTNSPIIKSFKRAVGNLIVFLTEHRRIFQNFINNEPELKWHGVTLQPKDIYQIENVSTVGKIIDTSLFLCYFYVKPMMLGPLLRLPNNQCDSSIVNKCLLQNLHQHSQQHPIFIKELLDFYYGRSLHEEALNMLYKLAHDKTDDHDNEFDDFIRKPNLTIQYLQKLNNDNLDLIFKFGEWVLFYSANDMIQNGENLFMNDSYECESYDCFKVIEFLINKIENDTLIIKYLEWLIFESDHISKYLNKKQVQKLHTKLGLVYLNSLKKIASQNLLDTKIYKKLYKFLGTTKNYEPWTVLKNIPTDNSDFLRLTVMIFKRLGEHEKSIDVLFNQLDDLDAAMEYCCEIYYQPHNSKTGTDLLHKLLEDLLVNVTENEEPIAHLLDQQGSKMSILKVLSLIPDSFPVNKLSFYLSNSLRNTQEVLYDTRISTSLYKVGSIKLHSQLLESKSAKISVKNAQQICPVCEKKLGYSVYSVNAKGEVTHYGCATETSATTETSFD